MAEDGSQSNYGKRPLWQWIVIYLIIGGIIYALIYFFFFGNKNKEYNNPGNNTMPTQPTSPGQGSPNGGSGY